MPTLRTRPFFTDNPGDLPYTYDVPASVELVVQSIVARFDGSGAGEDWLPCLSLYTQDGHLMARSRCDQVFAAGDTGVVTWGPFFRRQVAAATPSGASLGFATMLKGVTSVTPINGNFHTYTPDFGVGTSFRSNDSRLTLVTDTPPRNPPVGIGIPGGVVVQVMTAVDSFGAEPDGQHDSGWQISGSYSVRQEGPGRTSPQAGGFGDPLTDDFSGPASLVFIDHLSSASDWVVGLAHEYDNWTNGAQDFRYGVTVTILGDRPT